MNCLRCGAQLYFEYRKSVTTCDHCGKVNSLFVFADNREYEGECSFCGETINLAIMDGKVYVKPCRRCIKDRWMHDNY